MAGIDRATSSILRSIANPPLRARLAIICLSQKETHVEDWGVVVGDWRKEWWLIKGPEGSGEGQREEEGLATFGKQEVDQEKFAKT